MRLTRALVLCCVVLGLSVAPGCAETAHPDGAAARPVDKTLVAFLSKARAAHHYADLAEKRGDRGAAIRELSRITEGARPELGPEVREVVADAHSRIAELAAAEGDPERALAEVEAGLAVATEITPFRGHLFEVRGVIHEQLMRAAEARGDAAGAEGHRKSALDAFSKAMDVQEQFILESLPSASPPR